MLIALLLVNLAILILVIAIFINTRKSLTYEVKKNQPLLISETKNYPKGKLQLCPLCSKLSDDVLPTKEGRIACRHCRITVLNLAS